MYQSLPSENLKCMREGLLDLVSCVDSILSKNEYSASDKGVVQSTMIMKYEPEREGGNLKITFARVPNNIKTFHYHYILWGSEQYS